MYIKKDGKISFYIIQMWFSTNTDWRKVDLKRFLLLGPAKGLTPLEDKYHYPQDLVEYGITQATTDKKTAFELCEKVAAKFNDENFRVVRIDLEMRTSVEEEG